jgi:hypothetical protein
MIDWRLHHEFLEDVVSPWLHVNVLPVPRLFLVQCPLNKELKCSMEVPFQFAILRNQQWQHCINGLWKVLMKHVFPGPSVVALEYVFKPHKGV